MTPPWPTDIGFAIYVLCLFGLVLCAAVVSGWLEEKAKQKVRVVRNDLDELGLRQTRELIDKRTLNKGE